MRAVPARWTYIYRRYGKARRLRRGHRNRARGRVIGRRSNSQKHLVFLRILPSNDNVYENEQWMGNSLLGISRVSINLPGVWGIHKSPHLIRFDDMCRQIGGKNAATSGILTHRRPIGKVRRTLRWLEIPLWGISLTDKSRGGPRGESGNHAKAHFSQPVSDRVYIGTAGRGADCRRALRVFTGGCGRNSKAKRVCGGGA
jgi:hypothetical protein